MTFNRNHKKMTRLNNDFSLNDISPINNSFISIKEEDKGVFISIKFQKIN